MKRTILLIEDDELIAAMLVCAINSWGYEALCAAGLREASEVARERENQISMIICDVVLNNCSGPAVAAAIRSRCPQSLMVFTSGYPLEVLNELGLLTANTLRDYGAEYLQKPFLPRDLRAILEASFASVVQPAVRCAGVSQ